MSAPCLSGKVQGRVGPNRSCRGVAKFESPATRDWTPGCALKADVAPRSGGPPDRGARPPPGYRGAGTRARGGTSEPRNPRIVAAELFLRTEPEQVAVEVAVDQILGWIAAELQ